MGILKLKVGVVFAVLFSLLTVGLYLFVVYPQADRAHVDLHHQVERAARLIQSSQKLSGYELIELARKAANDSAFHSALNQSSDRDRRIAVFDAIGAHDEILKSKQGKAHFFGVVDREAKVIARDLNINAMNGQKLAEPVVGRALSGFASCDVWDMNGRMMRVAAAPVYQNKRVVAAIVLAYDIAAKDARDEQWQFGAHVAYFINGKVRASSFRESGQDREDATQVANLNAAIFNADDVDADSPLANVVIPLGADKATDIELKGRRYTVAVGAYPAPASIHAVPFGTEVPASTVDQIKGSGAAAGWVVLASVDDVMAPVNRLRWLIGGFGLLGLFLLFGAMATVSRHFVNAEDRLELGVSEIINGNFDYTFDDLEEFEGLANALNVMLARLLGRPEPGDDDDGDSWRADHLVIGELNEATDTQRAQMASETDAEHHRRIFREYVSLRNEYNLGADGLDENGFVRKLVANASMIRAKHGASSIRFEVAEDEGQVVLCPLDVS